MGAVVRISLIALNTIGFAVLAIVSFRASRGQTGGLKYLNRAGAAAFAAVAIGGMQRLLLQGVAANAFPDHALETILVDQAFWQALIVMGLGFVAWRSLRTAEDRVTTADDLLMAFGGHLPNIDWTDVRLTRQEEVVFNLLAEGVTKDAEIGERLNIASETARSHVKSLLRKTGLSSRLELAVAAHRKRGGLAESPP